MQFDSINAFFNMGGYGFYVWLSYGSSALFLISLILLSRTNNQNVIKKIVQRQKREKKLRLAAKQQNISNTTISPEESHESTS